jgi:hypothetical protein
MKDYHDDFIDLKTLIGAPFYVGYLWQQHEHELAAHAMHERAADGGGEL